MITLDDMPRIDIAPGDMEHAFDRVPFGFTHELHRLDLFAFDTLQALASKAGDHDHFVASSAAKPETDFYAVEHGRLGPREALDDLASGRHRVLIKRPEKYEPRFRVLLDTVFAQICAQRGGLRGAKLTRLDSSILISSADAITPFHFDPETSFFFQIEGDKIYHLYAPATVAEPELERFYKKGIINIGQLDLGTRDRTQEYAFPLVGGKGLHQPHNAPHWVETRGTRSISYVISFETDAMRALNGTRAFNHYLRKTGLRPGPPGSRPQIDVWKARTMASVFPLRRALGGAVRGVTSR